MGAQHPGHLFHRFQAAPHGPEAPIVEKAAGPGHGFVLPEIGEGQVVSLCREFSTLGCVSAFGAVLIQNERWWRGACILSRDGGEDGLDLSVEWR